MTTVPEWTSSEGRHAFWADFTPGPLNLIPGLPSEPELRMLRLDLLGSWATGNKYYKLKYALRYAMTHGITTIVSKGGMFSNHLLALAEACHAFKIQLVAVIRSYAPDELNPNIRRLRSVQTEINYLHPEVYKDFDEVDVAKKYPSALFIPEGGLSDLGIQGTSEIVDECMALNPSHIILAGGSMGTACGIISSAPSTVKIVIVPCWKGCTTEYVDEILGLHQIKHDCPWELWPDYHFGGFGKYNQKLIDFMVSFSAETGIPLDPVYTGKVMYAVNDRIKAGDFSAEDSLLVLHTGGLQGLSGYKYRFPKEWGGYLNTIET
jgi:1-aminocyclopropane-1-carboxylate deaminase